MKSNKIGMKYDDKFKDKWVREVLLKQRSISNVAQEATKEEENSLSPRTLRRWVDEYRCKNKIPAKDYITEIRNLKKQLENVQTMLKTQEERRHLYRAKEKDQVKNIYEKIKTQLGQKTLNQLCSEYGVHRSGFSSWLKDVWVIDLVTVQYGLWIVIIFNSRTKKLVFSKGLTEYNNSQIINLLAQTVQSQNSIQFPLLVHNNIDTINGYDMESQLRIKCKGTKLKVAPKRSWNKEAFTRYFCDKNNTSDVLSGLKQYIETYSYR